LDPKELQLNLQNIKDEQKENITEDLSTINANDLSNINSNVNKEKIETK